MKVILILLLTIARIDSNGQTNPVIIELFTSQGCSSCPAADKNLTEIIQRAEKEGKVIYGLSFHVDYWNYIGWKDPYSSKESTERQRKYADQMNLRTIYTPQMIVNGHDEFVGSNKSAAEKSIQQALKGSPAYEIKISNMRIADDVLVIHYALDKEAHGEILNVALVARSLENNVARGENQGKRLHHDNVVRSFKTVQLKRNDEIQIPITPETSQSSSVILYVQDAAWHIVAATSAQLN